MKYKRPFIFALVCIFAITSAWGIFEQARPQATLFCLDPFVNIDNECVCENEFATKMTIEYPDGKIKTVCVVDPLAESCAFDPTYPWCPIKN